MRVQFFDDKVRKFCESLEKPAIGKLLRSVELLEQYGSQLGMPYSKKIGNRLFMLRMRGRQEVRVFYTVYQGEVFLLHGFVKKSQKIPAKELTTAYQRLSALDAYHT